MVKAMLIGGLVVFLVGKMEENALVLEKLRVEGNVLSTKYILTKVE